MKRVIAMSVLILLSADFAYSQSCQSSINGAKARAAQNRWQDANKVLGENLKGCKDVAEYRFLYGITLAKVAPRDSAPKAIRQIQAADDLNGDNGREDELQANIDQAMMALWGPLVNDGIRTLSAGNIKEAKTKLQSAAELNPEGKEAHLGLGAVYQAENEYDKSIAAYRTALDIDPGYKMALLRLGQVYQLKANQLAASGDSAQMAQASEVASEAVDIYQSYLDENPEDFEVKIQLAGLHATLGQVDQALPLVRDIMGADSMSPEVLTHLGSQLVDTQQYEIAEAILAEAIALTDSMDFEALAAQAYLKIQTGDLEEARTILRKQVELEPNSVQGWENLGFVMWNLGERQSAEQAFSRAANIDPGRSSEAARQTACHPSYPDLCIPPPPPQLSCREISGDNFRVRGTDPHVLDGDNDGIGCEN